MTTPLWVSLAVAQLMTARVSQSLVRVGVIETNVTVLLRLVFFPVQVIAMFWMAAKVIAHAPV